MRYLLCLVIGFMTVGCATMQPYVLTNPFDPIVAKDLLSPGNNKIYGSALIRQQGGGIVTCAGCDVQLIPVTPYSEQRMMIIYESDQKGYKSLSGFVMPIKFEPDPWEYYEYRLKTIGEPLGTFEFNEVGNGEYFLVTTITWYAGHSTQGGNLMQRVKVTGNESIKIILTP